MSGNNYLRHLIITTLSAVIMTKAIKIITILTTAVINTSHSAFWYNGNAPEFQSEYSGFEFR
jgi:hypothetical protein